MIRNLRLKFILIFMALNTIFAAFLLGAAMVSARDNLEEMSRSVLRYVVDAPPRKLADSQRIPLPYFTVDIWGGIPSTPVGSYTGLEDEATVNSIICDCLSREKPEGVLTAYGLRYARRDSGWHERLAFVDMSMERATLRNLLASWLLLALTALIPLLGLSILLAWWAAAPAEKALRQQRQFLSDASHELKTPLTVILSNADLLDAANLPDRPRRWADNIRTESRRMRSLVEEMLSLARADSAAGGKPVRGLVSLSDVAAESALSFEPVAFEAGKPLQYEIAPDVLVYGDGEKLRRLVSVLLDNAIKYGAEGGTILLTLDRTNRDARLTVSNPGEPIPPEVLSRLFERFYRGDASRGEQTGFGLGLSIADAIAKEHRGTLRAESGEDATRFLYAMPLARPGKKRGAGKGTAGGEAQTGKAAPESEEAILEIEETAPGEPSDGETGENK